MKKTAALFLVIILLLQVCACTKTEKKESGESKTARETINYNDNFKGVWLSYYEIGDIFLKSDATQAQQKLDEIFGDLAQKGINTVFFHARAFADAFYQSEFFPRSKYCAAGYDLLELAVKFAHKHNISLHAWVNPYRVALDTPLEELPENSPAVSLYKESADNLILTETGIFFNPASVAAQKLIVAGIREIAENYAVDGIGFDDYFYPGDSEEMDKASYAAYLNSGGKLNLCDYRRESVSNLIAAAHTCIKGINPNIVFGISPQCFIEKNRDVLFADVAAWVQRGSVDYLLPQIYFGFENETAPFEACVNTWVEFLKDKDCALYVGLALYKSGKPDEYASEDHHSRDSAYYEWINNDNIIAREIKCLKAQGVKGYCLYSYTSLYDAGDNEQLAIEVENLLPLLKD
ncbi:MAG: family 10 glycosylhydrolase [Clostridia bacterium]|nr:family 10 glycosylhydrolase [Clostridia bacterium]